MSEAAFSSLLAAPARQTRLFGQITYLTGDTLSFTPARALAFSCAQGVSDGRLLGAAAAASCRLTLDNTGGFFTNARTIYGAQVRVLLAMGEQTAPLAVFTVTDVSRAEGDPRLTLSGMDALGTAFDAPFQDDFSYPLTLGQLAVKIADQAGFSLSVDFPNAAVSIAAAPEWGEISLRQALSHAAQAAGCFALIEPSGKLRFARVWDAARPVYDITPEITLSRVYSDEAFGPLQGLSIALTGAPKNTPALTVQTGNDPLTQQNSLSLSRNPLFAYGAEHTAALAQGLLEALDGLRLTRMLAVWRGDPALTLGSPLRVTDSRGAETVTCVTRQTLSFSGGFAMQSDCTIRLAGESAGRLFSASGGVNAARLTGELNGVIVKDGSLAASALVAGSVTARELAAGAITAEKIGAHAVTAEKLAAGAVDADALAAGAVTAGKIAAGAVEADALSAGALSAVDAHLQSAQVDWAAIGELRAAISAVARQEIGAADIDFAHIKDLSSGTALITRGSAGELYVSRLQVTEGNLASLTVGQLVVRGEDGGLYALSVDEDGNVTTAPKQIGNEDISDHAIDGGEKLVSGSVTAAALNAQSIFGESALINQLIAANLDVDTLFVRDAAIAALNALDIRGNQFLKLYVESKADADTVTGLLNRMNAAEERISQDAIVQQVTSSKAYQGEMGNLRGNLAAMSDSLSSLHQGMRGKADADAVEQARAELSGQMETLQSRVTQLADSTTLEFSRALQAREALQSAQQALEAAQQAMALYLRVSAEGVEIGRPGDPLKFTADNATASVNTFEANAFTVRRGDAPEWTWRATASGLGLQWIG